MKKRGGPSRRLLPVLSTEADMCQLSQKRRVPKQLSLSPVQGLVVLLLAVLSCGVVVVVAQRFAFGKFSSELKEPSKQLVSSETNLPLSTFPSLRYALRNSDLVILYFAASWCRMSTPVTELLDETFQNVLLVPPDEERPQGDLLHRHGLSLVYVSSDEDEEDMLNYLKPNWMHVPFHSEEREALKRRFAVCARRELAELGMERKHEIPTAVILSGRTHNVLTFHGVKDVQEYGIEAVQHWADLERLSQALSDKYDEFNTYDKA
jgi:hypothetical protein